MKTFDPIIKTHVIRLQMLSARKLRIVIVMLALFMGCSDMSPVKMFFPVDVPQNSADIDPWMHYCVDDKNGWAGASHDRTSCLRFAYTQFRDTSRWSASLHEKDVITITVVRTFVHFHRVVRSTDSTS